uniref:Uncharacterized protein n=1 Tax=Schizaphis graminum TaxID=13262 RepID=A0A2S2NKF7_SCHGA
MNHCGGRRFRHSSCSFGAKLSRPFCCEQPRRRTASDDNIKIYYIVVNCCYERQTTIPTYLHIYIYIYYSCTLCRHRYMEFDFHERRKNRVTKRGSVYVYVCVLVYVWVSGLLERGRAEREKVGVAKHNNV